MIFTKQKSPLSQSNHSIPLVIQLLNNPSTREYEESNEVSITGDRRVPFNSSDVMSADIPHGLPGARSAARAFPCKRCTPRKVSSLFPWVSSCSTRWNQASPAPPSSPAGFTLRLRRILLAVMAKLPGTCERAGVRSVARIRVRMNLYVCVCVCVYVSCVTIRTCLRAKKEKLRENGNLSKKNWFWFAMMINIFRQENFYWMFLFFMFMFYSGLWPAMARGGLFEIVRNGMKVITCFNIHCRPWVINYIGYLTIYTIVDKFGNSYIVGK